MESRIERRQAMRYWFDPSAVPAGATVSKSTFHLFVDAVVSKGRFDVY